MGIGFLGILSLGLFLLGERALPEELNQPLGYARILRLDDLEIPLSTYGDKISWNTERGTLSTQRTATFRAAEVVARTGSCSSIR